jgi:endonuclease YncB( thermonuclease family)
MKWLCLFAALTAFLAPNIHAQGPWVTLADCHYVPNDSNDGDSFHVQAGDKEYVFRLYFVDAPEMDSINAARLVEQAKYFGLTVPEVIEVGREARAFVQKELSEPFSVTTRFAHAMARGKAERFLAFVQTKDGDLGEQLVANGFARIFGTRTTRPGTTSAVAEAERLANVEKEAKEKHLGGWSGKVQLKAEEQSPTPAPEPEKLDVNNATKKELEKLPGIGPVLAQRIIDARPMKSANDLQRVDGIGPKKYKEIRPFFE